MINNITSSTKTILFLIIFFRTYNFVLSRHIEAESKTLSSRVVRTRYGPLRGFVSSLPNRQLQSTEVFLGVPYAGAPKGPLRFMPPVTSPHWKDTRLADHLSPVCPQKLPDIKNETEALTKMPLGRFQYLKRLLPYLTNQSEDCLYLNIYVPLSGKLHFYGFIKYSKFLIYFMKYWKNFVEILIIYEVYTRLYSSRIYELYTSWI